MPHLFTPQAIYKKVGYIDNFYENAINSVENYDNPVITPPATSSDALISPISFRKSA